MSIGSAYTEESIRIGDQTATANALVDLSAVTTGSFQGKSSAEHSRFHRKKGLTTRENNKFTGKVNLVRVFDESLAVTPDMGILLSEPEAGRPRESAPATYHSGTVRNQYPAVSQWPARLA